MLVYGAEITEDAHRILNYISLITNSWPIEARDRLEVVYVVIDSVAVKVHRSDVKVRHCCVVTCQNDGCLSDCCNC